MSLLSFFTNPVTFAAVAVMAIGVVIYEIVNRQEDAPHSYQHSKSSRSDRGTGSPRSEVPIVLEDSVRARRDRRRKETKPCSQTNTKSQGAGKVSEDAPHSYQGSKRSRSDRGTGSRRSEMPIVPYEETIGALRERIRIENEAYLREQIRIEDEKRASSQANTKSQDAGKVSEEPTKFNEKDYCQNVFDKIGNDVQNLNKDSDEKKTFHKNIDDGSSSNTSLDEEEIKVSNLHTSNASQGCVQQDAQNVLGRENVYNQENIPTSRNDPCCSSKRIVANDKQNHTETGNSLCNACDEVLANAVAYPCKHCYLCINCAAIVHRIYRKCKICESEIEYYQTIEMPRK